jgi:hypothetical protein
MADPVGRRQQRARVRCFDTLKKAFLYFRALLGGSRSRSPPTVQERPPWQPMPRWPMTST